MGDWVMIGPHVLISTVNHPLSPRRRRNRLCAAKPVHIGGDVWIGGNATILPGVTIGNGSVVSAGAVVTKDVPPMTVVAGVPARVVKEIEDDLDSWWRAAARIAIAPIRHDQSLVGLRPLPLARSREGQAHLGSAQGGCRALPASQTRCKANRVVGKVEWHVKHIVVKREIAQ